MSPHLRIGVVAAASGVSVDTIRHYERKGVIAGVVRDASGYRRYTPEVIDRVRVVRKALAIGFTLDELGEIFGRRAAGQAPCRMVHQLAVRKLADLDQHIEESLSLRRTLAATLNGWRKRLEATPEGEPAHLLDALTKRS